MSVETDNTPQLRMLVGALRQAAGRGDAAEAERLYQRAQKLAPRHPLVRNETAMRALASGNAVGALAALEDLVRADPRFTEAWLNLAIVRRALKLPQEAIGALDRVIALDPDNVAALLEKGSLQEQQGELRAAAITYFSALQRIPPGMRAPPVALRASIERAQRVVDANHQALESFISGDLARLRSEHAGAALKRFDQCVELLLKKRRPYTQKPTFLYFPEMPTVEFHDRCHFPWLDALEAASEAILAELLDILAERGAGALEPYHPGRPEVAAAQAGAGAGRWRSYPFWRESAPFPEHMARCPRTMEALRACPLWDPPSMGPNAMFSVLDPGTRIPPHTGPDNTRLVAHLGLIIPPHCGFRVGGEQREWRRSEAFVFDDTIEHEAWNDSGETRAVLIVDVWAPSLSDAERNLLRALSARVGQYYGRLPSEPEAIANATVGV
jgi:aspartyl/asparaginyl beta-hydroxylase (cupin superfamily)